MTGLEWIIAAATICGIGIGTGITLRAILRATTRDYHAPRVSTPVHHEVINQPQMPVCIAGRDCSITGARGESVSGIVSVGYAGEVQHGIDVTDSWPKKKVNH